MRLLWQIMQAIWHRYWIRSIILYWYGRFEYRWKLGFRFFKFNHSIDIYTCKNGIEYDENNPDCTTYDEIADLAGDNDCFEFEMYYPSFQYDLITNQIQYL